MIRFFLTIVFICVVCLACAQQEVMIVPSSFSNFATEKDGQTYMMMPLLPHQYANYNSYSGEPGYAMANRVRNGLLCFFNALPKQLLIRKVDSLKQDSYKLLLKIRPYLPANENITVNIYYFDQHRYEVGLMLHCSYYISKKKIEKIRTILQEGREVLIPPDVNSRLDSFSLKRNQFIMHDTANLQFSLITICDKIDTVTLNKADPSRSERKECAKLLFHVLKDKCNQYLSIGCGYLDAHGFSKIKSIELMVNDNMIQFYERNKGTMPILDE